MEKENKNFMPRIEGGGASFMVSWFGDKSVECALMKAKYFILICIKPSFLKDTTPLNLILSLRKIKRIENIYFFTGFL